MGRTKLTQKQKDLIAVLPSAIQQSEIYQKLTDAHRLVLAQIDLQDGTDFSAENDYVFRSNQQLMKDTGISSEHTVIDAVRRLVNEGLITTKRGYRNKEGRKASEYVLTDKYYKLCERENPHNELQYMYCNNQNVGCNKNPNCSTDIELEPETDIKIHDCNSTRTDNKHKTTNNDMKIDERFVTQDEKDAAEIFAVSDGFDPTQYNEIVKTYAGNNRYNETKSMYDERNEWITRLFERLDSTLNCLSQCYDKGLVAGKDGYGDTLNKLFKAGDSKIEAGWLNEKQIGKYNWYINRYNGLMKDRRERFGLVDKAASNAMTVSNENIISNSTSDSDDDGGCAAPQFTEEKYMEALKEVFKDWNLFTYCGQVGYGLYDYRKEVADILDTDIDSINESKFERDVKDMFIPITAQEPIVAYG